MSGHAALYTGIEAALGVRASHAQGLSGGCIGEVYAVDLADGRRAVVKVDRSADAKLDIEGAMLQHLANHSALPVPEVWHTSPGLLVMSHIKGTSQFSAEAEAHAAELLAALHGITSAQFGHETATLIGGLHQPNPWTESWVAFFRDERLLHMAEAARAEGRMPADTFARIHRFADRIDEFIEEPTKPSLLHGDVWTTNVLASGSRITGFIDPAIYYGHPEIELAFTTLFGTFHDPFFHRYHEIRPIAPGFFELRRDLYNLYPLLVHVRLFGSSYLAGIESTLSRIGF